MSEPKKVKLQHGEEKRSIVRGYLQLCPGTDGRPYLSLCDTIKVKNYQLQANPFWETTLPKVDWNFSCVEEGLYGIQEWHTIDDWAQKKNYQDKPRYVFDAEKCKKIALESGAFRTWEFIKMYSHQKRNLPPGVWHVSAQFMNFIHARTEEEKGQTDYKNRMRGAALRFELLGHYDFETLCKLDITKSKLPGFLSPKEPLMTSVQTVTEAVAVLMVIKSMRMSLPLSFQSKRSVYDMFIKRGVWNGLIKTRKEAMQFIKRCLIHSDVTTKIFRIAGPRISSYLNLDRDLKKFREAFHDHVEVAATLQITVERKTRMENLILNRVAVSCGLTVDGVKKKLNELGYMKAFIEMLKRATEHPKSKAFGPPMVAQELRMRLTKNDDYWKRLIVKRIMGSPSSWPFDTFAKLKNLLPAILNDYADYKYAGMLEEVIHCLRLMLSLMAVNAGDKFGEVQQLVLNSAYVTHYAWQRMACIGLKQFTKAHPGIIVNYSMRFNYCNLPKVIAGSNVEVLKTVVGQDDTDLEEEAPEESDEAAAKAAEGNERKDENDTESEEDEGDELSFRW